MDCEYILIYRTGASSRNEFQHKFHAATPKDAIETARLIIKDHQAKNVRKLPFAPVVVRGELYRQLQELNGFEFIKATRSKP